MTARLLAAGVVFVLVADTATDLRAAARVVSVLLAVATAVAGIALLEVAQVPAVMDALTAFRPGFHVVGGQLRATSTLSYPTVASMYLEVAFALGLWRLLAAVDRRVQAPLLLTFIALAIVGAGIVATFTRAGLASLALSLGVVGGLRALAAGRFDKGSMVLGARGVVLVCVTVGSRSPERLLARLSTEGSQAWYGARYVAPARLTLVPGGRYGVPVTLENRGRLAWRSDQAPPFLVSYHWLLAGSRHVVQFNGARTPFPGVVEPGQRVTVRAAVVAPATPGWYDLVWDVVHEHRAWLSTEGVASARTRARVSGPPVPGGGDAMQALPEAAMRPHRLALWRTALALWSAHPLTGIGPDNFRLMYGPAAGWTDWDTRVHTNNLYLEVLVGAGLPGLAALLWLMAAAAASLWRRWLTAAAPAKTALAAALAVWATVAGHGLVDVFLAFTPTYVVLAIAAGLAFSPALTAPQGHAHRL
jgi:hypothetical protein